MKTLSDNPTTRLTERLPRAGVNLGRAVAVLAGAVLVAAAGLKAHQLVADGSVRWNALAALLEAALGLWLLAGTHPRTTRAVAGGCFVAFAVVAGHQAVAGEESCGCFGRVRVAPLVTVGFDVAIAIALACCHPGPMRGRGAVAVWVAGAVLVTGCAAAGLAARPAPARSGLVVSTPSVELWIVDRGRAVEIPFTVTNAGVTPVEIASIESSCGCMSVRLDAMTVRPGEAVAGVVTLDLGREPGFTGELAVTARAADGGGRPLFALRVAADVR